MTDLDGNAAAGPLADALGVDLTAAVGRCGGCGRTGEIARARAFVTAMGTVVRCPGCERELAVIVRTSEEIVVSLDGLAHVRLPR